MRAVLVVFAAFVAVSAAYVVNDASFGIHTAIPGLSGAALTFNPAGDLFVYDSSHFSGCLFKFPNASNTPPFTQIPFSYGASCTTSGGLNVGLGFAAIISTDTGRLYLSNGMEINPATGAVVRRAFQNCNAQHGIARDPRDGAIFFSDYSGRKVYRVENPDVHPEIQNPCATPFANTGADANTGIDGLTVGPDGLVYMAGYDASAFLVYSAYSAATPTGTKIGQTSTGRSAGSGPDGISICFGDGVSFAITADAGAHLLHRFNLTGPGGAPAYAVSTIVSGTGGYNDWTAVDTKGCIWGSTLDGTPGVFRLSNADGSCLQCATPQAPADGCNCQEVVNVQQGATTATASSNGACVAMHFQ